VFSSIVRFLIHSFRKPVDPLTCYPFKSPPSLVIETHFFMAGTCIDAA
jgi:hypothetical protein